MAGDVTLFPQTTEQKVEELLRRTARLEEKVFDWPPIMASSVKPEPKGYVYVAGPMRGIPEFNFPAFKRATERLRAEGYEVFSPAENDEAHGFDPVKGDGFSPTGETTPDLRRALSDDTHYICNTATHIYMLKGWEKSSGARAEHALAVALGLILMYEGDEK